MYIIWYLCVVEYAKIPPHRFCLPWKQSELYGSVQIIHRIEQRTNRLIDYYNVVVITVIIIIT